MTGPRRLVGTARPARVVRTVRVDAAAWDAATELAAARGETVSDVVRRALDAYVVRHTSRPVSDPGPTV